MSNFQEIDHKMLEEEELDHIRSKSFTPVLFKAVPKAGKEKLVIHILQEVQITNSEYGSSSNNLK